MEQLDPRVIPLQRIGGGIFIAVLALGSLVALVVGLPDDGDVAAIVGVVMFGGWLGLVLLGAWQAYRWPPIAYRHTSFKVDDQGIEIRRGVYWRVVINIPRSRVQHIDVSQGPVERRYGLGTLVIYTAGTEHAKVQLEGLAHARALAIREHLLPSGTSDAV